MREPFQFLREMYQTKRLSDLVRENRVRYTVMNSAVSSNGAGDDVRTEAKTDTDTRLDAVVNEVEVNEDANMTKPLPPPQQQLLLSRSRSSRVSVRMVWKWGQRQKREIRSTLLLRLETISRRSSRSISAIIQTTKKRKMKRKKKQRTAVRPF